MFQGRWPNTLNVDAKHRLTLPTVFRGSDESEHPGLFFVGVLTDDCMYLHTKPQHDQFMERLYRKLGDSRESRRHKTVILSRFVPVTADANGRITIPAFMLEAGKIQKEVILISQKSRVEVWGVESFKELEGGDELSPAVADALEAVLAEEEKELHENIRGDIPG